MVIEHGDYRGVGIPIKLSDTPGTVRTTPQPRGADTRDVLAGLGLDADTIDNLIASGVAHASETVHTAMGVADE